MDYKSILGIAGVNYRENAKAKRIGGQFEVLVLLALLAVFVQLLMYYSGYEADTSWLSTLIWIVFAAELFVNLYNVNDRPRYLRENWLNVLIVILAFPWIGWHGDWAVIMRSLRLLLFLRFFAHFYNDVVTILKRHRLGQILIGAAFMIVGAGGLFSYIEDRNIIDGIWYAIVTVTTVGYGDVVPQTENGRIFGTFLILFGVVLFSLVTANISAFLIGSGQRKQEKEILNYVRLMEERLERQTIENQQHVENIIKHMTKEIQDLKSQSDDTKSK
ncbi:potassium channel family protein [Thiomicrorhabdus sp. ZW0627]|uniref:potassium channel family protein n=1 Tax=Thiomicrorhabdus sp. ZW0627 TaxID=3039774 RepID=UPI0024368EF6|nr:potassium channel family protein [Thiomicrorhabdus sp. ZW0627]MDG6773226.1 potassium channel family protein [Thiomicrorhabdus sp. ZW0627]